MLGGQDTWGCRGSVPLDFSLASLLPDVILCGKQKNGLKWILAFTGDKFRVPGGREAGVSLCYNTPR